MIDWTAVFVPQSSIAEVILRGTLIYFLLFFVLRFFLNRQAGAVGIPDLLVVVLIVESTTDALGRNETVTEAAILISTVMCWSYGLQWIAFRFKELVTEEELQALLRTQGVDELKKVKLACLESSGDISVVTFDQKNGAGGHTNRARNAT